MNYKTENSKKIFPRVEATKRTFYDSCASGGLHGLDKKTPSLFPQFSSFSELEMFYRNRILCFTLCSEI